MDLVAYLHDEINFLTEQKNRAKKEKDNAMDFLCDARITEAKRILEQIDNGTIDRLRAE